ncbi:MAG TPA: hypothetical protein DD658_07795 [Deltaproteobacteria bacterium]|nr:MAG: hypothetical protein A2X88_04990 [Deltaproteobacteria bacterium GWC2_65_14]HBO70026.1 hypothetical protein [Deltaproteobacteria bacterium]
MRKIFVPGAVLAAALLVIGAAGILPGCFPKGQIYGVGNEGGLVFRVNPPDADVVLDGVVQGKASDFPEERYLKVASGTHRLELRMEGFESWSREVYVSNSLLRIEVSLSRGGPPPAPKGY